MPTSLRVADLSEEDILGRILPLLPSPSSSIIGPGDDAAVVASPDGRFVVTTDILVEGRHFRRDWSDGFDIGWRAAAQNIADVIAMGAYPTALVVSVVLPGDLPVVFVEDLARGLAACAQQSGAGVVGGDLSSGDQVVVCVTAHGDLAGHEPVTRTSALVGDQLAIAGTLGWSAAGLAVLQTRRIPPAEPSGIVPAVVQIYRRPHPPLIIRPDRVHAMMDVSDGLLRDVSRLARASQVGIDIDPLRAREEAAALVPVAHWLGHGESTAIELALNWVYSGGEDHGLLATFPAKTPLPQGFRLLGMVTATGQVRLGGADPVDMSRGWDHFNGA